MGNSIKTAAAVTGKILLTLLIVFILIALLVIIRIIANTNWDESQTNVGKENLFIFGQMGAIVISSLAMYYWFERKKGWPLGLKQNNRSAFTFHGLIAGILLMSISSVIIWSLGGISWSAASWDRDMIQSMLFGLVLFTCVAFNEELLSRGYIQGLLKHHYGSTTAIIVSSLIFALMHGINPGIFDSPLPILNLIAAGIILAVAREVTGGLWWPIGLHMTWNYFQGHVYGFKVSGTESVGSVLQATDNGPAPLSGGTFGAEGSYITLIVLLLGIVSVYYFYNRKHTSLASSLAQ